MIGFLDYVNKKNYLKYLLYRIAPSFLYKYIIVFAHKKLIGNKINLNKPQKLSEKIQWLKIYSKDEKKGLLSDKIFVKQYVKSKISDLKCAEIYQIADSFNDLDFDSLPDNFFIKTNNSWKTNVRVENKNTLTEDDMTRIKKFCEKMLKINYAYYNFYELQYKDIKPKIFCEELLCTSKNMTEIKHYDVWCFNGETEFIICNFLEKMNENEYDSKQYFFDKEWNAVEYYIRYKSFGTFEIPKNRGNILKYAQILSQNIDFVRVDFMEINGELYFGEMTFTPYSGFFKVEPECFDYELGKKLKIKEGC